MNDPKVKFTSKTLKSNLIIGECYTYGCRITYHCGDGYELVGKQAADCQADGTWSAKEIPTCVCKYTSLTGNDCAL